MPVSFKGVHFPQDIILMGVRWYVAYPLSTRHVEELMEERGVEVDHSTINRLVVVYGKHAGNESGLLQACLHAFKHPLISPPMGWSSPPAALYGDWQAQCPG